MQRFNRDMRRSILVLPGCFLMLALLSFIVNLGYSSYSATCPMSSIQCCQDKCPAYDCYFEQVDCRSSDWVSIPPIYHRDWAAAFIISYAPPFLLVSMIFVLISLMCTGLTLIYWKFTNYLRTTEVESLLVINTGS